MGKRSHKNAKLHAQLEVFDEQDHLEQLRIKQKLEELKVLLEDNVNNEDGFLYKGGLAIDTRRRKDSPGMVSREFHGHKEKIYQCSISHNLKFLVSFSIDAIRIFRMKTAELISILQHEETCKYIGGAMSTSNQDFVCYIDKELRFYRNLRMDGPNAVCTLSHTIHREEEYAHDGNILDAQYNHNGNILATASSDSSIILWRSSTAEILHILGAHRSGVYSCRFNSDSTRLVTTSGFTFPEIKVWDTTKWMLLSDEELEKHTKLHQQRKVYKASLEFVYSAEGTLEALMFGEAPKSNLLNDEWYKKRPGIAPLRVPPKLCSETISGCLTNKNENKNENKTENENENENEDEDDAMSTDTARAYEGDADEDIPVPVIDFTLNPSHEVDTFACESMEYPKLDTTQTLFHTFSQPRNKEGTFIAHVGAINAVCFFHRDKNRIVTCSSDKSLKFWDICEKVYLGSIHEAHTSAIMDVSISQNDELIASASLDGFVKIWKAASYDILFVLRGHFDSVYSVIFNYSDTCVLSASGDRRLIMWRVVPSEPDAPFNVEAIDIECHSITLRWSEPLANASPLKHFEIHASVDEKPFRLIMEVPATLIRINIPDLLAGAVYQFKVVAVNEIGRSEFSAPTEPAATLAYKPSPLRKPCKVADLTATNALLTFGVPDKNGAPITAYHIRCVPERVLDDTPEACVVIPMKNIRDYMIERQRKLEEAYASVEQQKLNDGKAIRRLAGHDAKMKKLLAKQERRENRRAMASSQLREESKENETKVKSSLQVPSKKRTRRVGVEAEVAGAKEVVVSSVPKGEARSLTSTSEYLTIEEKIDKVLSQEAAMLSCEIACLLPGTIYQIYVAAENRCGVGAFSDPSSLVKTERAAPNAPQKPVVCHVQSHQVDVTWKKPRDNGVGIGSYTVKWLHDGREDFAILNARDLSTTLYTIQGLKAGKEITVWVSATNIIDKIPHESFFSEPSDLIKTKCAVPDQVQTPVLKTVSSHSLRVFFLPPCDNGSHLIAYHMVVSNQVTIYGMKETRFVREMNVSLHDIEAMDEQLLSVLITSLSAENEYIVQIAASNEVGKGDYSSPSLPRLTESAIVPGQVKKGIYVSNLSPNKATLSWESPEHDGGMPIQYYVIKYNVNGGPYDGKLMQNIGRSINIDFLKPKNLYQFTIAAVNKTGCGVFSEPGSPIRAPTLVEFTIAANILSRTKEEHDAARKIQKKVQRHFALQRSRRKYYEYVFMNLSNWPLL